MGITKNLCGAQVALAIGLGMAARVAMGEEVSEDEYVPLDTQNVTITAPHLIDDGLLEHYFQTSLDTGPAAVGSEKGGKSPGRPGNKAQEPPKSNN